MESPRSIRAHAGFLNCAIALIKYIDTLVANSRAGHVLFTGHSAGGAVASLLFLKYLADARKNGEHYPKMDLNGEAHWD
jgi:putative lipase involved disintegration of autophagic bodies